MEAYLPTSPSLGVFRVPSLAPFPLPAPGNPEKPQPAATLPSTPSRRRIAEENGIADDFASPAKRSKPNASVNNNLASPSKERKVEEDNPEKIDDTDGDEGVVETTKDQLLSLDTTFHRRTHGISWWLLARILSFSYSFTNVTCFPRPRECRNVRIAVDRCRYTFSIQSTGTC